MDLLYELVRSHWDVHDLEARRLAGIFAADRGNWEEDVELYMVATSFEDQKHDGAKAVHVFDAWTRQIRCHSVEVEQHLKATFHEGELLDAEVAASLLV